MKKTIKNLLVLSLFAIILTGCSKEEDDVMNDIVSEEAIEVNEEVSKSSNIIPLYRWDLRGNNHFYSKNRKELYSYKPVPNPVPYPYNTYPYNDPTSPYYHNNPSSPYYYPQTYSYVYDNHTGYRYEGVAFKVFKNAESNLVPLYRYYNGATVDHMLTVGTSELGNPGRNGWKNEGIVGYVYSKRSQSPNKGKPIYRYYNARAKDHFYTTSYSELGGGRGDWRLEGVIGYAAK